MNGEADAIHTSLELLEAAESIGSRLRRTRNLLSLLMTTESEPELSRAERQVASALLSGFMEGHHSAPHIA